MTLAVAEEVIMKHQLSFATINVLSKSIVEVIINEGVEVSMEMLEECDDFFHQHLNSNFAMLVNKINNYSYSFEVKMTVASQEELSAIAVVVYNNEDRAFVEELTSMRAIDGWNLKIFSGLDLGWQEGYDWLQSELESKTAS